MASASARRSGDPGMPITAYGPPVCEWGYYAYYPYACAPYGYYGPDWFYGGVFIGAGPWYGWGWGTAGAAMAMAAAATATAAADTATADAAATLDAAMLAAAHVAMAAEHAVSGGG